MAEHTELGSRAERKVKALLLSKGLSVHKCSYGSPFDLDVNGLKVEVKASKPRTIQSGRRQHRGWLFNIHRHGKVRESNVDFYILRLEDVPEFKSAVHLVIKAPLNVKTVLITFRSLLTKYGEHFNRFDLLRRS